MKKMITALCILAVAVGSMMAVPAIKKVTNPGLMKIRQDAIADQDRSSKNITGWTSSVSNQYDTHYFGYGWYIGPQKKIAFDPTTGILGSCYRQADSEAGTMYTGSIGGMASRSTGLNDSWKGIIETSPLSRQNATVGSKFSGRYPSVAATDGHLFGLYNNVLGDGDGTPSATISVYSNDEESWSPRIGITDGTNTPPDAWSPMGAAVKDADGVYHLLLSYELTLNKKDYTVITGKSSTPFVPSSWTWSNWNDIKFGETINSMGDLGGGVNVAWGQNGFGIVIGLGMRPVDEKTQILYMYTTNYGQTWQRSTEDATTLFKVPNPCEFVGWPDTNVEGETTIYDFTSSIFDVCIDEYNNVHFASRVYRASSTAGSYLPNAGYCSSNDKPINGILYVKGEFNGSTIAWSTGKVIAEAIGGREGDTVSPEDAPTGLNFNYMPNSQASVHIGTASGSMVYIGYLDRPVDAKHITEVTQITPDADTRTEWLSDGFMIYSSNSGSTWEHGDATTMRGFNLTNTRDIHEQGFSVSRNGKKYGANGDQAEIFAGYQVWAPDLPQIEDMKVNDFTEWQQKYYAMQIKASNVGIETETTALSKDFALDQNYPNPFNPTTAINFSLQTPANVKLSVFNAQGQEVANLINANMVSGAHTANFNAANLNSGVYFYKLSVDGQSAVKKMVLTK